MATSLAASAATLLSLPPRVRGDVQGCANVSIGRIAWAPATPSFTTPARAAIRLLWWGEHGRGTWLMEGEHASFIIRCARADMIAYLNDMQTMVLDIHDGHDGRSIAESTVDLSLMVSDVLEASLPVISKASAVVGYLSFRLDVSFSDAPSTQLSDPGPIKLLTASDPSSLNSLKSFDDRSKPGEYAKPTKAPGNLQIATSPAPLAENVPGAQKAQMRPSSKPQATVKGRRPQHRKDGNSALQKENIARLLARGRMLRERLESAAIEAPASTSILVNALNEAQPSSDDDADVLFAKLFFEPNGSEAVEAERQKKKLAQAELRRAKDLEAKRQEAAAAVAAAAASEAKQSSTFDVTLATLHLDSAEFPAPHIVAIRVDFEEATNDIVHVLSTIAFNGDVDIRDIGTGARVARLGLQRETTVIAHTFSPHFRHCEELAIKTNEGCNAFGNLHVDVVHHFTDVSNDAAAVCVASCDVSLSSLPVAGWFPMYQDRAEYRDTPVSTVQLAVRLCSDPPPEQSPRPSPSPAKPVAEEERTIEYVVAEKELETVTTAVPGSYSLVVEVDKLRGIPDNGFYILVFRFRDQVHSSPPQRGYDVHSRVLFPVIQCEDATAHDRVHVEVWSCSDVTSSSPDILLGTAFVDVSSILHHPSMDVPPVIQEIERCEPVVTSLPATLRARVEVDVPRPPPAMNGFQTPLRRTISYRQPARLPRHIDPSLFMTPPSKSPTLFVPLEPVDDRQPGQDGHLVVTCKQAACIASPDALTGMLFVSFALAPRPSSAWQAAQSVTGLVPGSSHPIWAYRISLSTAVLPAPDDLLSRRVEFTLFHRVSGDADKPIGKGSVSIASVVDSGKFADWVDLVDNSSPVGYLYVILAPDPILLDALKHATPSAICPPNEGSPQTKCSNSSSDIIQVESEEDCEDVEVSIEDPVGPLGVPDLIPPASMDDLRKRMRELDAVRSRLDTFDSSAISKPDLTPSCTPLRRRAPTVFTPAPVQVHVEIQTESAGGAHEPVRATIAGSCHIVRFAGNEDMLRGALRPIVGVKFLSSVACIIAIATTARVATSAGLRLGA
ncbi:unnamed protein product (mitochondrion) [Plasmodiophora brassicae]|uniref:C2 domain-containing protein n=1 Tax=Plasmodiophora brassicae TaxID=37360 RepID=A0A3P3YH43_PLABS|nr:unnamed protein product [Plasmodiophora brassicae]